MVPYVDKLEENHSRLKFYFGRIWVPRFPNMLGVILDEAHKSKYSICSGTTKMFYDLRSYFWRHGMIKDIVKYVTKCLTCSRVKAKHQQPYGKLQSLDIPEWKWEHITMDLVTKLPNQGRSMMLFRSLWTVLRRALCSCQSKRHVPWKS